MSVSQQQIYPHSMPPDFLSQEEVALLKRTMLSKFSEDEQDAFIRQCQRTKLDPFTRQIHATRRYQKVKQLDGSTKKEPTLVPVTGIQGLTAVADRTGQYDGCEIHWCAADGKWREEWLETDPPAAARCKVFHKHRTRPEVAIARWDGFVGTSWDQDSKRWVVSDFWEKLPDYMLGKCAKAAALRGAFPDQLSNLYIGEELDSHISDTEADLAQERLDNARTKATAAATARAEKSAKNAPPSILGPAPTPEILRDEDQPDNVYPLEAAAEKKSEPPRQPTSPPSSAGRQVPFAPGEREAQEAAQAAAIANVGGPVLSSPADPPPAMPPLEQRLRDEQAIDSSPEPAPDWWKEHQIKGVRHVKYQGRKVGELNQPELNVIESQWIPAVREQWDDATEEQKEDYKAFEAALAFYKTNRPW